MTYDPDYTRVFPYYFVFFTHPLGITTDVFSWHVRFSRDLKVRPAPGPCLTRRHHHYHAATHLAPALTQRNIHAHGHIRQVAGIQLQGCTDRARYGTLTQVALYDVCFERCLSMAVDYDKNVVDFLSLSPFKGDPLLLVNVYEVMVVVYE